MTPQEKADELVDKMMAATHPLNQNREDAIRCAKVAAEQIVKAINWHREMEPYNFRLWSAVYRELKTMINDTIGEGAANG